ncbi:MAG: AlbA family DNA-binding domain-containing protein, partial [Terriglobales bacterium]
MSFFTKSVNEVNGSDLSALVDDGAVENVMLEFKRGEPSKDEMLKKLSSFANTFGGRLVVGAEGDASGRLVSLPGVPPVAGYKQKIVAWCVEGAAPPVVVEVSEPIPAPGAAAGAVCYVIYVPESDLAPHFLNGRKGLWVRTNEFSARFEERYADERDVRGLLERRRAVRSRRAALLSRARARFNRYRSDVAHARDGAAALCLSAVPRFPHRPLVAEGDLVPRLRRGESFTKWRGRDFPGWETNKVLTQHESLLWMGCVGGDAGSLLEVNVWGLVSLGVLLPTFSGGNGIHPGEFAALLLLFSRHLQSVLDALGYGAGSVLVGASLDRLATWSSPSWSGQTSSDSATVLDEHARLGTGTAVASLRASPDELAAELLRRFLFAANRSGWAEQRPGVG